MNNCIHFDNDKCKEGFIIGFGCNSNCSRYETILKLYHGSGDSALIPSFRYDNSWCDYGKGFYTTERKDLAAEWSIAYAFEQTKERDGYAKLINPEYAGYLYTFDFNLDGLKIFDFENVNAIHWIAELLSHVDRFENLTDAQERRRALFVDKFLLGISEYDVIKGWRADASFIEIALNFLDVGLDYRLLSEALKIGDLDVQYCIKSEKAFNSIENFGIEGTTSVDSYGKAYMNRMNSASEKIKELLYDVKNDFVNYNILKTLGDDFNAKD